MPRLASRPLWAGVAAIVLVFYFFLRYFTVFAPAIEAMLFAGVLAFATRPEPSPEQTTRTVFGAALLNTVVSFASAPLLVLQESTPGGAVIAFAVAAGLGAAAFAMLLNRTLLQRALRPGSLLATGVACAPSALALNLPPDSGLALSVHKALWFVLFAGSLQLQLLTLHRAQRGSKGGPTRGCS